MVKFLKKIVVKFFKDSCLVRASGLAYSTLLAIVPFITIIYAFGGFDSLGRSIESALLRTIMPGQEDIISQAIDVFTKKSLTTGTIGMIFFLLTSIFLINTVARNLDAIWGVVPKNSFFRRYAAYTAILVFGSLLLGLSNSLSNSLEGYFNKLSINRVNNLLPFVATFITLFFMLTVVPTAKVRIKSGLIGALISTLIFEVVKIFFKYWVTNSVKISLIYGSLAVIPVFLFGLYLFWIIVLIGVEITFVLQNGFGGNIKNFESLGFEDRVKIGIDIFLVIAKKYLFDRVGGVTSKEISKELNIPSELLNSFLDNLLIAELLIKTSESEVRYIPSRSLSKIYLKDLVMSQIGDRSIDYKASAVSSQTLVSFIDNGFNSTDKRSIQDILSNTTN